jgi:hypothetical protein
LFPETLQLVTFVQPTSAEAKLMQYDNDPELASSLPEGAWHAEMWREAKHLGIPVRLEL